MSNDVVELGAEACWGPTGRSPLGFYSPKALHPCTAHPPLPPPATTPAAGCRSRGAKRGPPLSWPAVTNRSRPCPPCSCVLLAALCLAWGQGAHLSGPDPPRCHLVPSNFEIIFSGCESTLLLKSSNPACFACVLPCPPRRCTAVWHVLHGACCYLCLRLLQLAQKSNPPRCCCSFAKPRVPYKIQIQNTATGRGRLGLGLWVRANPNFTKYSYFLRGNIYVCVPTCRRVPARPPRRPPPCGSCCRPRMRWARCYRTGTRRVCGQGGVSWTTGKISRAHNLLRASILDGWVIALKK